MRSVLVSLAALALITGAAHVVHASEADVAAADVLFTDGRRAADAGDWNTACAKFSQSYQLDPAPGALLNLGDCEEHRDHLASAWRHFRKLADGLPDTDERKALADRRAADVLGRAPRLKLLVANPSPTVTVTRDGAVVGRASFGVAVPVDAGSHTIVVRGPGLKPATYDVTLRDGETRELAVNAVDDTPSATAALAPPPPAASASTSPRAIVGWTILGAGGAGFVLGAVFGGVALSASSASDSLCTDGVCRTMGAVQDHERAKAFALATDITLGFGAALAVTGLVLVLTAPKQGRTVEVRATAGGIGLGGTF